MNHKGLYTFYFMPSPLKPNSLWKREVIRHIADDEMPPRLLYYQAYKYTPNSLILNLDIYDVKELLKIMKRAEDRPSRKSDENTQLYK